MITLEVGKIYFVKHSSGIVQAKFLAETTHMAYGRNRCVTTRYHFINLTTSREIVFKSKTKIKKEISNEPNPLQGKDSTDDGPEVGVIRFFRTCPEGLQIPYPKIWKLC